MPPSSLSLKLTASANALRYFVLSQTHQQVIFFGDYTLHHISNPTALANAIEKIFEKDEVLQLPFAKVLIGLDEKYELVPHELVGLLATEGTLVTSCTGTDIVFEAPNEIIEVFKRLFVNPEFIHLNSTFLHLLPAYVKDTPLSFFVNVGKEYIDTIWFSDERLRLMNRYEYRMANDFIYFVLLCCDELKIDRDITELVLMGEVDIQSKIYELCYRYFRQVRFIQKPASVHFSRAFEIYPKHLHFNLYSLQA